MNSEIKNSSRRRARVMADMGAGRIVAAFASVGAAAIHFATAPDHYTQWWAAGVFFYGVGAFQCAWAAAALRTSRPAVTLLGLLVNAGVIATWAVSRTAGIPFGPSAGIPEDITRAGVTAVAFEAVVCLVSLLGVWRPTGRGFASSLQAVVLVGVAGALVTGLTMPAVETARSHSHSHGHGAGGDSSPHGHHEDDAPDDKGTEPQETAPGAPSEPDGDGASTPSAPDEPGTAEPEPTAEDDGHGHEH